MDYYINRRINLTELHRRWGHNTQGIRHELIQRGLNFAAANQFAMFAVFGFHGPTEKQTLNMAAKSTLSILDEHNKTKRKEPPAWNRP